MRKTRFTEEQIAMALRQGEVGTPVAEIIRKLGISEQTYYRWKRKYGGLGVSELRELKAIREENRRLKTLVADLSLDKTILREALRKNGEPDAAKGGSPVGAGGLPATRASGMQGDGVLPIHGTLPERAAITGAAAGSAEGAGRGSCELWI